MLSNCNYNKIRMLHDMSRIIWYLDKHAREDAKQEGHELCINMCDEIKQDLEKHISKLKDAVCGLCSEGKF